MLKKSGFTLIELIVSVSIMGMMTALFLVNYHSANRRSDLTMTAQKMVADIRMAQNYALGLARYGAAGSLNVPTGGWGLNIDLANSNKQYLIFADDDGDKIYDSGEANLAYGALVSSLPSNIIIESLSVGQRANITFLPPDPITTIYGPIATSSEININLKDLSTNNIKTVKINFLGLVELVN